MNEPTAVPINWIPLKSSMLEAAAYNDEKWVLSIRFKSGLELAYQEVPPEVCDEFITSLSQGKYYNANIKGKYEAASRMTHIKALSEHSVLVRVWIFAMVPIL